MTRAPSPCQGAAGHAWGTALESTVITGARRPGQAGAVGPSSAVRMTWTGCCGGRTQEWDMVRRLPGPSGIPSPSGVSGTLIPAGPSAVPLMPGRGPRRSHGPLPCPRSQVPQARRTPRGGSGGALTRILRSPAGAQAHLRAEEAPGATLAGPPLLLGAGRGRRAWPTGLVRVWTHLEQMFPSLNSAPGRLNKSGRAGVAGGAGRAA